MNELNPPQFAPLERETFLEVVKNAPLGAIALLAFPQEGKVLLGLRRNAPAKNYWYVPGGRIHKGERLTNAFQRISHAEIGSKTSFREAKFVGVFEHLFEENFAGVTGFGTHYITLAYRVRLPAALANLPETQHRSYRWLSVPDLLNAADVHPSVKNYFAHPLISK